MNTDLTAFLSERLDERERDARHLLRVAQDASLALEEPRLLGKHIPGWHSWPDVEVMCGQVLAGIEADRAVVRLHAISSKREERRALACEVAAGKDALYWEEEYDCFICGWFDIEDGACATVRHLAGIYGGHPDYRQGWKP
jgi:Family of unknown function (DUF6221)